MASDKESIQTEIDSLEWFGAVTRLQGGCLDDAMLRTISSGGAFSKELSLRRRSQRVTSQSDHNIWLAAVRCWILHSKLAHELGSGVDRLDRVSIDALAVDRWRALMDLARMRSNGLHGIVLKKYILVLVAGDFDEMTLLLRSCLADCDRAIGSQAEDNLIKIEPELATLVAHFFQTVNQLANESARSAELSEAGLEGELPKVLCVIQDLGYQIETAIDDIASHPAMTVAGLDAKLKVFEMCDRSRGAGPALFSLRVSMFRDLDRLVEEPLKKPVLSLP